MLSINIENGENKCVLFRQILKLKTKTWIFMVCRLLSLKGQYGTSHVFSGDISLNDFILLRK